MFGQEKRSVTLLEVKPHYVGIRTVYYRSVKRLQMRLGPISRRDELVVVLA
jgi:hypothetical protein